MAPESVRPSHSTDAPPPPRRAGPGRRRRARRLAAGAGVFAVAAAAGTCALPRPGLPPGAFAAAGGGMAAGTAGARYGAGPLRRALLGDGYRDAWSAPVRVPLLDLDTVAGGLALDRAGGGNQTRSLHLRGGDGRDYVFRSVDKSPAERLGPAARAAWGRVRQDQVAALHPAAGVVAAGLLDAAGVPHASPRLAAMPDDARLGEHRAVFAGLLGTLEENPRDGFAGAPRVVGSGALWDALAADSSASVDARAFLAARLMDVFLGDWDRHDGQWRWGRVEDGGAARWIPIPRDRDYAFVDYGGALPGLARRLDPKIVRFDAGIRDLRGLLAEGRSLDARILCPLPATAWDSTAAALRAALPDDVVDASVRRMPGPWVAADGARLTRTLRARRERLPAAARDFRRRLHADGACRPG